MSVGAELDRPQVFTCLDCQTSYNNKPKNVFATKLSLPTELNCVIGPILETCADTEYRRHLLLVISLNLIQAHPTRQ